MHTHDASFSANFPLSNNSDLWVVRPINIDCRKAYMSLFIYADVCAERDVCLKQLTNELDRDI